MKVVKIVLAMNKEDLEKEIKLILFTYCKDVEPGLIKMAVQKISELTVQESQDDDKSDISIISYYLNREDSFISEND